MGGMAIEAYAISELLLQRLPEAVAQRAHAIYGRKIARKLAGLAEAGREQRALGTCAAAMLVPAAVKQRLNRHAIAHEQGADALGGIGLVAGNRQKIDAELIHLDRNLADGLGGVGVKQHGAFMGDAGAILNRLDGSDLVVGVHDADEDRARRVRSALFVGINAARAVNRQIGDAGAQALEKPARFDDGRMLDARRDDVIAPVAARKEHALEGKVVGLAAAAGENDLVAAAAEQRRHLAAR